MLFVSCRLARVSVVRGSRFQRCEGVPAEWELRELRESSLEGYVRRSKAPSWPVGRRQSCFKAVSSTAQPSLVGRQPHPRSISLCSQMFFALAPIRGPSVSKETVKLIGIYFILVEDRLLNSCDFNSQWRIDREITQKRSNEKIIIYTRI